MTDMECVHSNLIKLCVIHCSSPSVHKLARKFLATELSKYFSLKMYKKQRAFNKLCIIIIGITAVVSLMLVNLLVNSDVVSLEEVRD